jgi:O-antigen/teichoic acid export membrane protein
LLKAFSCNLLLVGCGAAMLLLVGNRLLRFWAGPVVAQSAGKILLPIVLSSALLGLGVTGTYALQALGMFRTVAIISVVSRAAMLLLMIQLMHHMGLQGLALSRLCYGATGLLVYLPLFGQLNIAKRTRSHVLPLSISYEVQEEAKLL